MKVNVSTPSGFPEFGPAQEQVHKHWTRMITEVFELFGAMSVTTPIVEREENLVAKGGNPKEMYVLKRLLDDDSDKSHSGNALRFDHTVPLALYTARHMNDIAFPFKRYSIGPVFRGERAQKGRYRQFTQCDLDIIGSENLSIQADGEAIAVAVSIFEKISTAYDLGDFVVHINNRKLLIGFFASLGIDSEQIKPVMAVIDDVEKYSAADIDKRFAQCGIDTDIKEKIQEFISMSGNNVEIIERLKTMNMGIMAEEGIAELQCVLETLDAYGVDHKRWVFDMKIVRGLEYYTGTVFEMKMIDERIQGTVCAGGRYDDLAGIFTGKKLPGVGMSIGLTRLLGQLFDENMIEVKGSTPLQVLFVLHDKDLCFDTACAMACDLRAAGVSADTYKEDKKIQKQFDYAHKIGVPYVAVLGEDEIKKETVMIKNMRTGKQKECLMKDLLQAVQQI